MSIALDRKGGGKGCELSMNAPIDVGVLKSWSGKVSSSMAVIVPLEDICVAKLCKSWSWEGCGIMKGALPRTFIQFQAMPCLIRIPIGISA